MNLQKKKNSNNRLITIHQPANRPQRADEAYEINRSHNHTELAGTILAEYNNLREDMASLDRL
ncbi:hypothetical protein, partial [Methanocalculus sp. MSAO_Arc2]|uniref:hypothetical protein n=1 Tax=Methanocalculus sp. MSAO_Arc2 TaxID=2293855 RepID=UPI0032169895